jgi:predicted kinase
MRARVEQLAKDAGVSFSGVLLEAPADVLAARVEGRAGDASDANVAVLMGQIERLASQAPPGPAWSRIDASGPSEESAEDWTRRQA